MLEKPGNMKRPVLALSWLIVFCSHLKTAAQISSFTSTPTSMDTTVASSPNASFTDMTSMPVMPTEMMSNTIITMASPSISDGSTSLVPSSAIMVTSQPSIDTTTPEFTVTIATTVTSPVPTTDTSTSVVMSTNVVMTTNIVTTSIIPRTTAVVITTSNPVPVPSGDVQGGRGSLGTGAIIGIATGGGTGLALLVILVIVIYCCCCRYQKQHHQEIHLTSPTIQSRPEDYIPPLCRSNSRVSQRSFTGSLKSLRDSIRHKAKEKPEDTTLIITPL